MGERRRIFSSRGLLPEVLEAAAGFELVMPDSIHTRWLHDEIMARVADAEGLVSWGHDRIDREVLEAAPKLRVVAHMGVGYDCLDVPLLLGRGLVVTHTPDVLTETTSDMALALLLAVARRVVEADRLLRAGQWKQLDPYFLMSTDPAGQQLGIVGFGRIGQALGRKARGLGMRIAYTDVAAAPDGVVRALEAVRLELDALLQTSRFVSLHVPLTPQTRHLIGRRELALMPPGSFLINTSRGPVVDTAALIEALASGHLAGVGLDVYETEPGAYPELAAFPNAVLTPHIASCSRQTRAAMGCLCLENIVAVLTGREPLTPIPEWRQGRGRTASA